MMKFSTKSLYATVVALFLSPFALQAQLPVVTVDGSLNSSDAYSGGSSCLQDNYTQFGNSTTGTVVTSPQGSEIDGVYGVLFNSVLYLMFTGNLEGAPNSNRLEIFIDSKPGGQNVLGNNAKPSDFENPNKMTGLKFDADFESDYWLTVGSFMSGANFKAFIYAAATDGDSVNGFVDNPVPDIQLNSTGGPYNWTYAGGKLGWNNSNVAGVGGAVGEVGGAFDPATVTTGIELAIPLSYIGNQNGIVKVCAFINSAAHDYVSNQVTCGLGGTSPNLQDPKVGSANYLNGVDFSVIPNNQYITITQLIGINQPFELGTLSVSPNPATDKLHIQLQAGYHAQNETKISLFDLNGTELQNEIFATESGKNNFEMQLKDLSSGVYLLNITNGNYSQREKIIISNQ